MRLALFNILEVWCHSVEYYYVVSPEVERIPESKHAAWPISESVHKELVVGHLQEENCDQNWLKGRSTLKLDSGYYALPIREQPLESDH